MAQITKSLSLDVSRQNRRRAILAKQFDNGSRFLNIQLNNEGEPITVAQNSVVLINATRADGASESFVGGVNDDGSVTVPITYWMLEVPGKVMCDVSVISELESKLSTLGFAIEVEKANGTGDDIAETEDCGILVQLISDVKRLEDNFKSVFVRYSANADGTDYSDVWSDGMQYIGIANTDTEPSDKSGYIWCKFAADEKESNVTVDAELSLESENPVQNKAVTQEFKAFNDAVGEINRRVSSLESGGIGGGSEYEIPTFDLAAMGLPNMVLGGNSVRLETDTTEIMAALDKGAVRFDFAIEAEGDTMPVHVIMNNFAVAGFQYICTHFIADVNAIVAFMISAGIIVGVFAPFPSGSGGVSSWNDLTDKPFGGYFQEIYIDHSQVDTSVSATIPDPSTGDLLTLIKLSDETVDRANIVGITFEAFFPDGSSQSVVVAESDIVLQWEQGVVLAPMGVPMLICYQSGVYELEFGGTTGTIEIPEVGCYAIDYAVSELAASKMTCNTLKQLDNKYLEPFEFKAGEKTEIIPEGTQDGFVEYSDAGIYVYDLGGYIGFFSEGEKYTFSFDGKVYDVTAKRYVDSSEDLDVVYIGNLGLTGFGEVTSEPFVFYEMPVAKQSSIVTNIAGTSHTIGLWKGEPDKWLLKEECLPFDAIAAYIDNYIDEALGGDY